MAGHSQFKNIMHRKGAQDKKRAKIFSRATKEIIVAVKIGGEDPDGNPRLRSAIAAARSVNMPKDNIERAIKKGAGDDASSNYEEMRYEGYGPSGVAIIVDALTDNRNRTASEVRSTFTKFGGNLGESNSVIFQFDHVGEIVYDGGEQDFSTVFDAGLEAGAEDVTEEDQEITVRSQFNDYNDVREALEKRLGVPKRSETLWHPHTYVDVSAEQTPTLVKLLSALEDNDDAQQISSNARFDDAALASMPS